MSRDDRSKEFTGVIGFFITVCLQNGTGKRSYLIPEEKYPNGMKGLKDTSDFLYSTIDVAIWSTCETGIGLAASAAATLRPLLRQVFGELSITENSKRKHSRTWTGKHPSRSGYLAHPSQGDDNDIRLKDIESTFTQVHVVSGGNLSPSGSTTGLRNWEHEKDTGEQQLTESIPANGGIMKTVKITQS
ncbi:hypothetical protein N0V90_006975 [Kalmusia sp. IMI 367209]|nr:hypothetical protein N0V90_006975 [Kalmusia sp. IMI 367209]